MRNYEEINNDNKTNLNLPITRRLYRNLKQLMPAYLFRLI